MKHLRPMATAWFLAIPKRRLVRHHLDLLDEVRELTDRLIRQEARRG